ncbi:ABC transporter substrate-binding protein [Microbacterium excoecariae]|uniref:ABC transporter substrate-binding protein n=1 Tax=Microbacterium excoecariae TaxID=2715210 RepID=UPI001409883A|nr:sugar ABC transporter substrate-binding protein [Microbacterium excoecariae]NHI15869.1 sugar ABC transporter substrate-binding protein [Microbacterium excoecariae]
MRTIRTTRRRVLAGTALAGVATLALASCSGGSGGGDVDTDAALEEGGTITVWAWEPTLEPVIEDFEADNPGVTVELVNVGTGIDSYTALQNAITAGQGLPDLVQIEYYALPQFALQESLTDLTEFGADEYDGAFATGPWDSVHSGEQIVGLPMDSGPMALFYNKTVFDEYGVEVPATWEEFAEAAAQFQEANPDVYIGNESSDAGFAASMMWQAGGTPWTVDGTNVSFDLTGDAGAQAYAELWQGMLDDELLAPIEGWTDEWFQGMANGTLATLPIGAWMPANLESSVPDGSGDWRVAPMPQWTEGEATSSENGGSSLAIPADAENKELAYAFMEYANAGDGVQTRLDNGAFPATTADLESDEFLNQEFEYFGGQKINEVLAESSANVVEGWQYLPFQVYANTIFGDSVGQAFLGDGTISEQLGSWQSTLEQYGADQGFTIE